MSDEKESLWGKLPTLANYTDLGDDDMKDAQATVEFDWEAADLAATMSDGSRDEDFFEGCKWQHDRTSKAFQARIAELEKYRDDMAALYREVDGERNDLRSNVRALDAEVERLRAALEKIANYDTLDGGKYISHEQGWHGVAQFAKEALKGES